MSHLILKHLAVVATATVFLFSAVPVLAHEGEDHDEDEGTSAPADPSAASVDPAILNMINNHYLRDVKPIFKKACFNCHSEQTRYPAYYAIPGVHQLIDYDIREARKHIDMNADFPFKGHGTPLKDLKAIQEEVEEGGMPPLYYKIFHWKERLTDEDAQIIQRWTAEGIKLLPPAPPEPAAGK